MFEVEYICENKSVYKSKLVCPICGRKASEMLEDDLSREISCLCGQKFEADKISLLYRERVLVPTILGLFIILTFVILSFIITSALSSIDKPNIEQAYSYGSRWL